MANNVIEAVDVCKAFGPTQALDEFNLTVPQGEVMGFLGPNGAGKSTMIRILIGMLRADSGRVTMLGKDPWVDAVDLHRSMAYVPGDVTLWPNLSGGETIDLLARLGPGLNHARRADLIERFDFDPTKKSRAYSKGNRQKVGLIAALASEASVLLLDEPTSGLDPLMEAEFQRAIRERVENGVTVLLSSHILAEVDALCDRVTIIANGRTVEQDSLSTLRHQTGTRLEATTVQPIVSIQELPGVHEFGLVDECRATMTVDPDALGSVMTSLSSLGIESLVSQPPTLEELFMRHYDTNAPSTGADSAVPDESNER